MPSPRTALPSIAALLLALAASTACSDDVTPPLAVEPHVAPPALYTAMGSVLTIAPAAIVFDSTAVTMWRDTTVDVTNTGPTTLQLTNIAHTGTFPTDFAKVYGSTCQVGAIAPSATCTLIVRFAPTGTGQRSASIDFVTDSGTFSLPVSGNGYLGAPALSVSDPSLDFGRVETNTTSGMKVLTLTNAGTAHLHFTSIAIGGPDGQFFSAGPVAGQQVCSGSVAIWGASSCAMQLTYAPTSAGAHGAELRIQSDGGAFTVPLTGIAFTRAPIIFASPLALNLGAVAVGSTTAPRVVTVANVGDAPMRLSGISLAGAHPGDFATDGATSTPCLTGTLVAPNASCEIAVTFTPSTAGARTATLDVASGGGSVQVALAGSGGSADVSVSMGTSTATAQVGKPFTYTITLRNNGAGESHGVVLTDIVPPTTTFRSLAAPSDVACTTPAAGGTGTVRCTMAAPLASGASRVVKLVVNVASGGKATLVNTATVWAVTHDPVAVNNSATAAATVYGRK